MKQENKSSFQIKYENGEFPKCFVPCPPFYDVCNTIGFDKVKWPESWFDPACIACLDKHGLTSDIE